jgi:hypothetical protein
VGFQNNSAVYSGVLKMQKPIAAVEQQKNRSALVPAAVGALALAGACSANAAIDVGNVTSEISGMGAPVAAIGGAIMLILVAIKAWKMIRRAM